MEAGGTPAVPGEIAAVAEAGGTPVVPASIAAAIEAGGRPVVSGEVTDRLEAGGTPAVSGGAVGCEQPLSPSRLLPGWVSALIYAGLFLVTFLFAEVLFTAPLALLTAQALRLTPSGLSERELFDPAVLGLERWIPLVALSFCGKLWVVLTLTAWLGRRLENRSLGELGLTRGIAWLGELPLGLLLAALLFLWQVGAGSMLGWYHVQWMAPKYHPAGLVGVSFLLLLPAAAVEEVCCRGFLYTALERSWGRWGAVIGSALAFASLHSFNPDFAQHPLAFAGLLLAGIYLGMARLVRGSLWLPIVLHTGWNLLEGPVFGLPVSGLRPPASLLEVTVSGPDFWTGGSFGPEAGLLLCVNLIPHCGLLWLLRRPPGTGAGSAETPERGA